VTKETTVCGAATTSVPAGTHTYGGVTTIVETATTIVCPYATVSSSGTVTTSVILETTYVCPSAGTYTIAPLTTTCVESTVLVYPTPATYAPGTYTHPEVVTTITETNYVVVCPYTSSIPAPVKPTYVAPVAPAKPTTAAPVVVAKPTYAAPAPVKPSPTPVTKPVKSGQLGTSGDHWAITYTPYTSTGSCKDATTVDSDLAGVAANGFTTIRLYSADKTDCNGLTTVGDACAKHGLTMIIGIYIKETGIAGAQSQLEDLKSFAHWSIVDLVVVGNEAIFSGFCSAESLVQFITTCKTAFAGCGYTGPITTTEPLNVLQQYAGTLCGAIDVVGCNIHPFFNADVDASSAGSFVKGQLDIVDGLCPGKSGYNLETGWPSAGRCNGKACPGPSEQAAAIGSIRSAVGGKSVMFSYINDEWKDLGEFGCERSWGISGLF
jgi:exo-beta-1,3-glucanase (GH17 family)